MRELRNLTTTLAMATVLAVLCACAGQSGPQDATNAGGGTVTAPAATGTQPPEGSAENPAGTSGGMTEPGMTGGTASGQAGGAEAAQGGGQPTDCAAVLCSPCPEGQTHLLQPPQCCRCIPIDQSIRDCSTVRCAACPEGQRPALRPPDCCRCIPDRP